MQCEHKILPGMHHNLTVSMPFMISFLSNTGLFKKLDKPTEATIYKHPKWNFSIWETGLF